MIYAAVNHLLYIRGGKGKKDRRVPLSTKLSDTLRTYYKAYRPKAHLFLGPNGSHYTSSSASKVLKRAAKRAGITSQVTLHTLRHSYATHLSGKDISNIRSPLDDMDI